MKRQTHHTINGIQVGLSVAAVSVGWHYWGCAGFGVALGACLIAGSLLHWLVDMKIDDEPEVTVELDVQPDVELMRTLEEVRQLRRKAQP